MTRRLTRKTTRRPRRTGAANPTATLQVTKLYSGATLGKAYLRHMGIRPILERQPEFPAGVLGFAMAAFYGGRAEARIRNVPVPVVPLDFTSMYPTVNALLGHWRLITAEHIEIEHATEEVRVLLGEVSAERMLDPAMWSSMGCTLVELVPRGERLPVRARYAADEGWSIGVHPVHADRPLWFALPDVAAAVILGSDPPEVRHAIRLVAHGVQAGLRPTILRGSVRVDPTRDDFFRVVIEERKRLARHADLLREERQRLSLFLKIVANATSYGVLAEVRRNELPPNRRETVRVHGLAAPFECATVAPETPGEFFFAPIAANITAAARCMLALFERLVTNAGGTFATADTDALMVVSSESGGLIACGGGRHRLADGRDAIRALSWAEVESIRQHFTSLNPYDRDAVPGSVLGYTEENFRDPEFRTDRRQLHCVAVSAKRHALYERVNDAVWVVSTCEGGDDEENASAVSRLPIRPAPCSEVVKFSEHGLGGSFLNPVDIMSEDRVWLREFWAAHVRSLETGADFTLPDWQRRMALSQVTMSTPTLMGMLRRYNAEAVPERRIRPFSFMLSAHAVTPYGCPHGVDSESFHLLGPFDRDPRRWTRRCWFNVHETRRVDREHVYRRSGERECATREWDELRSRILADGGIQPTREFPARLIPVSVRRTAGLTPDRMAAALGFEGDQEMLDRLSATWEAKRYAERAIRAPVDIEPPGTRFRVAVDDEDDDELTRADGTAIIQSIGAILRGYRCHPEAKSLGPNGKRCASKTRGLLTPRAVRVAELRYIGKEANRLHEAATGLIQRVEDAVTEFRDPEAQEDLW